MARIPVALTSHTPASETVAKVAAVAPIISHVAQPAPRLLGRKKGEVERLSVGQLACGHEGLVTRAPCVNGQSHRPLSSSQLPRRVHPDGHDVGATEALEAGRAILRPGAQLHRGAGNQGVDEPAEFEVCSSRNSSSRARANFASAARLRISADCLTLRLVRAICS